jgi:hypothetical protein
MTENDLKSKLFIDGLSKISNLVERTESVEKSYEFTKSKLLSEDIFFEEKSDVVYKVARDYDTVASDYIRCLRKELNELMKLSSDVILGSDVDLNKVLNK